MKSVILAGIALVILSGCTLIEVDGEVRFMNDSLDTIITWGVRVGAAEFVGTLRPGDETAYYSTPEGDYVVELRDAHGSWAECTSDPFGFGGGRGYTVRLTGSSLTTLWFHKEVDW